MMKRHVLFIVAALCLFSLSALHAAEVVIDAASGRADVPAALSIGDTLDLSLPGGREMSLVIVASPPQGIAGRSFIANDATGASAVIKPRDGGVRMTVDDFAERKIYVINIADGALTLSVHDKPEEHGECATCAAVGETMHDEPAESPAAESPAVKPLKKAAALRSANSEFPLAEHKSVVDILVAFDRGAKDWAENSANWGGGDTIEDFADYAVNKMNTVLANSQLLDSFSYRLVGVVDVDDAWTKIDDNLLGSLRTRKGSLAKLSWLREKCGADTITLLVDKKEGSTTGIGYEYGMKYDGPSRFDNMNYACNVCDIKTVHSRYTMSHETGHNMGCGHSNRQGGVSGPGRYSDSCGYHFTDASGVRRSTVMAYTYASGDNYYYDPVPYFSTPDIAPAEYGCALGVEGVNNNCGTLLQTYADIAGLREHVVPYEWDVRFLDGAGNEIADGSYFSYNISVTLQCAYEGARIYYTLDGTTPNSGSPSCDSGGTVTLVSYDPGTQKTITACAVVDGTALSVRTITLTDSYVWSGESGMNGDGTWTSGDTSVLAWNNFTKYFYNDYDSVAFPDLAGNASPTVSVCGTVSPVSSSFPAYCTSYTFEKSGNDSLISLRDAAFAPSGDLTFNVPVQFAATSFVSPAYATVAFNAPFGQSLDTATGYCTNKVVVGNYGTLVVAPGLGKTQTFDSFNNTGNYYSTATLRIGEGTVVFKGSINGGAGLLGSTKIAVGDGGNLVFDVGGATGYDVNSSSITIEKGGSVTFNQMEHLRRKLYLNGGTVNCVTRFDLLKNPGVYVTDDSSLENAGSGYVLVRDSDAVIDVSAGKTLTLNVGTQTDNRSDTSGKGLVKMGGGEIVANRLLQHSGSTIVSNGTLSVGYTSSTRVGLGWTVKNGATLKVKGGCSLAIPSLTLESGATLALSAANSAPLTATNEVNLSGVRLSLDGAGDLSLGKAYPVLSSQGGLTGVSSVVTDCLPALADGLEWVAADEGGTLYAKVRAIVRTLDIPAGTTVNLSDIPASIETITGGGTVYCGATLPDASLGWTSSDWKGTIVLEGLVSGSGTKDFNLAPYGNSLSRVLMRNCSIFYFSTTASFAGTLVLEGNDALRLGNNGYSNDYAVFGALEGDGTISAVSQHWQAYVFSTATNYTGSISIGAGKYGTSMNGRRIVFGVASSASDIPSQYASITVKAGATASIGGGATWSAYHGVEIAGMLLVKGSGATLDCNASANMGLKLDDGATLRFETADAKLAFAKAPQFAAGTVNIAFASGVAPTNGMVLATWPDGTTPAGEFAFADAEVSKDWALSKTATGLVVKRAPLPDNVSARITVRHWNGSAYVDEALPFDLPTGWVTNYFPSLDSRDAVAAKYNETAVNGVPVWQCYMLGLDPTNAESRVSLSVTVVGGKLRFAIGGLGETHEIAGISVSWSLKTSTDLASDPGFSNSREYKTGLPPIFDEHPIPDVPKMGAQTVDTLFYKVTATFVADDGGN